MSEMVGQAPDNPNFYQAMLVAQGASEVLAEKLSSGLVSMQRAGHFPNLPPEFMRDGRRAEVMCEFCNCSLLVVADPAPNEIHVSGTVFGRSCRHSSDVEEWLDLFNGQEGE